MAKDPAFLFYPNDFDSATKFLTNEQVGMYLRLLISQFQIGRLTKKQVLHICGTYDEDVMKKFNKDNDGLYYNERLEYEVIKRKKYSESRRKNRENKNKDKENISVSYVKHMENENTLYNNTNKNNIETPTKEKVWEVISRAGGTKEMAKSFYEKYESTNWCLNGSKITNFVTLANRFVSNWKMNEDRQANKNTKPEFDPTKVKIKLK